MNRNSGNNRRKNTRNANRKKQQQQQQTMTTTTTATVNNGCITEDGEQEKTNSPEIKLENNEKEFSREHTDEEKEKYENENEDFAENKTSLPTHVEDEQKSTKQSNQNQTNNNNKTSSKQDSNFLNKPQASIAPVGQNSPIKDTTNNFKSYPRSNGYSSPPSSYNNYTYSSYSSLPPRFQQQRQQREAEFHGRRHRRRRRGPRQPKMSSFPPDSAERPNDFIPASAQQQQYEEDDQEQEQEQEQVQEYEQQMNNNHYNNNNYQPEPLNHFIQQQQQPPPQTQLIQHPPPQQQDLTMNNGYSSESDILTDPPSAGGNNSISPILSTSADSQSSLQRLDLIRSLATSHSLLEDLISIFDAISFSSEELELILNKIATKHILDKHDLQRLLSTKNDKTLERILDETYRSQAKILAIELQTEKNRVLELTKSNADMENTIRLLQQQQPNNIIQLQQMIVPYQIQLRRLADENTRLQHQLHAYSMMPATLNELKQQQHLLNEQIRQMTIRNSALENEVAESERASKHAAEVYKKADTRKQEQIEQMISDINKYKKLDKELTSLRQKHSQLEKDFNSKINDITTQRDELKDKLQEYEELKNKYEQLTQNPTNQLQQELNELKSTNDQLRQSNWESMRELNKLNDQQQNQDIKSS